MAKFATPETPAFSKASAALPTNMMPRRQGVRLRVREMAITGVPIGNGCLRLPILVSLAKTSTRPGKSVMPRFPIRE